MKKKINVLICLLAAFALLIGCSNVKDTVNNFDDSTNIPTQSIVQASKIQPIMTPPAQTDKNIFADTMVEMNWEQVKQAVESKAVVLFPIAVVEEHGPHMDLSPDIYQTYIQCKLVKESLAKKGIKSVIAPPYYWGINVATGNFQGTFTVKPDTFLAVLSDSVECLKNWGFTKVIYINMHGDSLHKSTLSLSAEKLTASLKIDVVDLSSLTIDVPGELKMPKYRDGKFGPDYHAGANETASMWALYPDKVNVAAAKECKPQSTVSPMGYVGDPANFDLEDGSKLMKICAENNAKKIEAYLKQKK